MGLAKPYLLDLATTSTSKADLHVRRTGNFVVPGELTAVAGILDVALFGLQTVGPISSIAGLATLIPSISVFVRRLHDISRTGWRLLIALIPIIGWIILIVWACQPTHPQANEYGPPPVSG